MTDLPPPLDEVSGIDTDAEALVRDLERYHGRLLADYLAEVDHVDADVTEERLAGFEDALQVVLYSLGGDSPPASEWDAYYLALARGAWTVRQSTGDGGETPATRDGGKGVH